MLILKHDNTKVLEVLKEFQSISFEAKNTIAETLCVLAKNYPEENLLWCFYENFENLNIEYLTMINSQNDYCRSYSQKNYLRDEIGYIEFSPFIKINKKVIYPTWQMSACVGIINAKVLNDISNKIKFDNDFNYFLNSFAKLLMPQGLFCYSDCNLLLDNSKVKGETQLKNTYIFVKQHYKIVWTFLLFLNKIIYEKKFPIFSFLITIFYKKRKEISFERTTENIRNINPKSLDVLIPTIGRKEHLINFLTCLKNQSQLPNRVIIIEQNPNENSVSDFDFENENYPFEIVHFFTHKTGACQARNLGLAHINSNYVFFADDDILIANDFITTAFAEIEKYNSNAFVFSCLAVGQSKSNVYINQTTTFGSGCSIVKSDVVKNIRFDTRFEFGYGEDSDFGMQIRNKGEDILYLPSPEITHLKAPMGGFRVKPKFKWSFDKIQPKPSPTVLLFKMLHNTKPQILGYKTVLFFKYYRLQKNENILKYFSSFSKQWDSSVFYAKELISNEN